MIYTALLVILLSSFHGRKTETSSLYTVKSGDALWKIGQQNGVPFGAMQIVNNIKDKNKKVSRKEKLLNLVEKIMDMIFCSFFY